MIVLKKSSKTLIKTIAILKSGGVVVCPTDTVYGFLADAGNKKAVKAIYDIKKRPKSKPLPVFVKDFKMAKKIAFIDEKQAKILKKFWPGKYTLILKRKNMDVGRLYFKLYGVDKKTIAIRIPKYKFLNELLEKINKPLAQTSVNISGQSPLITMGEVIKTFANHKNILIINAGNLKKTKPSKIIDLTSKLLTRTR